MTNLETKTVVVLATNGGRREERKSFERDNHKVAKFYSPDQEVELVMTVEQSEEFETDTGILLEADVLDRNQFMNLQSWLKDNYELKVR